MNSRIRFAIALVLAVSLFFTTTNLIPLSLLFSLFSVFLLLLFSTSLIFQKTIPSYVFSLLLFYLIVLTSLFAYDPEALMRPLFYRYDGSFLICFLPVLVTPLIPSLPIKSEKLLVVFSGFASIISFVGILYNKQFGFFSATNAFGGFLMAPLAISLSWFFYTPSRRSFLLFSALLAELFISTSRGSILGFALSAIAYSATLVNNKFFKQIPIFIVILLTSSQLILLSGSYPNYLIYRDNLSYALESGATTKEANNIKRVYENWPRAMFAFLSSPIVGAGYGSVNDVPHDFEQSASLIKFNKGPHSYNDSHAHNVYFNILAELGLLGLVIFLYFLSSLFTFIQQVIPNGVPRAATSIMLYSLIFSSFTENRLTAPSNIIPFVLVFVISSKGVQARR